jgi:3-oxoacyl-[acyl-carrier protein] reductase
MPFFLKNHRGSIITVSSMWGQVGASCETAYSATKGAVIAMSKALAKELGPSGVRVNCIAPGPTQTGWIDEDLEKIVIPLIPMGKLIRPEDIAETILFLSSEQARMITGQVVKVSGGKAL